MSDPQKAALNVDPDGNQDLLGEDRLEYLRGERSLEQQNAGDFRNRLTLLGDLVHAGPLFVGPPSRFYPPSFSDNLGGATPESNYSNFKNAQSGRAGIVYAGANDGFVHGFQTDQFGGPSSNVGAELIAYMPSMALTNARDLADPNYSHRYYVDGPLTENDVYIDGQWRSILLGGLGLGGQGVYTLDITDPAAFNEGIAADLVRWEFSDRDDADLGFTAGQGALIRLHNGKWGVAIGNGYNNTQDDGNASTTGNAVLYVLLLEREGGSWQLGSNFVKLDTGVGTIDDPTGQSRPNGLASVFPVDKDGDFITDFIYAADLFGNVWRFNLVSTQLGNWTVHDYGTGSPTPLFTATDADGSAQPITTQVQVNRHPQGRNYGSLVFFGTGKYLENGDESPDTSTTQTFYSIWDKDFFGIGASIDALPTLASYKKSGFSRGDLQQQTISGVTQGPNGQTLRRVTENTIEFEATDPADIEHGWYLDLKLINTANAGEMLITDPVLRGRTVIFNTFIPGEGLCEAQGGGFLMVLDQATGGRLESSPFDINGDQLFDPTDFIEFGDPIDVSASGIKLEFGGGLGTIFNGNDDNSGRDLDVVLTSRNDGGNDATAINTQGPQTGRKSWRQLR